MVPITAVSITMQTSSPVPGMSKYGYCCVGQVIQCVLGLGSELLEQSRRGSTWPETTRGNVSMGILPAQWW